jgi:microcystin-dependent protein
MARKLQLRRGTAAQWTSADPVLAVGEPGFEIDTLRMKLGDGVTAWTSLSYVGGAGNAISALSALTPAAGKVPYFTSASAAAMVDSTSYGRALLNAADEAAFKALVNAEAGTDFATPSALNSGLLRAMPVGGVLPYAGASAPSGWLLCFGQAISRTTYASLFAAIGTTYGSGDGSMTFNVPDLRGRAVAGQDDMGGTSADRLTSPVDGDTLGAAGGAESVTMARSNLPNATVYTTVDGSHAHNYVYHAVVAGAGASTNSNTPHRGTPAGAVTDAQGSHQHSFALNGGVTQTAMANVQPTIVLNYIIFTDV